MAWTAEMVIEAVMGTYLATRTSYERLSFQEQRSLWNGTPFGRKQFKFNPRTGSFEVYWRTISRDHATETVSAERVAKALNQGVEIEVQR